MSIAAIITVIYLKNSDAVNGGNIKSYDTIEEAKKNADFGIVYTDKLAGYPETGYSSNGSTIEITYGDAGSIRKTYAAVSSRPTGEYSEESKQNIDGNIVTFKGRDGNVYFALWNENNYVYTIILNESTGGVSADEMTEYVKATK